MVLNAIFSKKRTLFFLYFPSQQFYPCHAVAMLNFESKSERMDAEQYAPNS